MIHVENSHPFTSQSRSGWLTCCGCRCECQSLGSAGACFTFFRFHCLTKAGQKPGPLMELMCFGVNETFHLRFLFKKSIWKTGLLFWKLGKKCRCRNRKMDNKGQISNMEQLTYWLWAHLHHPSLNTHHPWEGPLHLTLTLCCIVSESPVSSERLLWRLQFMQRSAGVGKNESTEPTERCRTTEKIWFKKYERRLYH